MANKRPIFVLGGGGHAKVLLSVLARLPQFDILGYVDPRDSGPLLGFPRLGGDEFLPSLAERKELSAAIGVGKVRAGSDRMRIFALLRQLGFEVPVIVAPSGFVAQGASLGRGTVVMDGVVVQPGCVVGVAGILNTNCTLDHDCVLGDDVHIATGATLSGNVTIGDGSLVGAGASLLQGVRVGTDCTVGLGAAVIRDCLEPGNYVGVPARRCLP